jgi:hypothetical protein
MPTTITTVCHLLLLPTFTSLALVLPLLLLDQGLQLLPAGC